jgi:hypothetical protein
MSRDRRMSRQLRTNTNIFPDAITPRLSDAITGVPEGATDPRGRDLSDRGASTIWCARRRVMRTL